MEPLQPQRRLADGATFHRRHQVQHVASRATGKTMKYVPLEVDVKRVLAFPMMNRTTTAILVHAVAPQPAHLVPAQCLLHAYPTLNFRKTNPSTHAAHAPWAVRIRSPQRISN